MAIEERFNLLGILQGLMLSENLGDIQDEIDHLHDLLGLPRPEGGFDEGWTDDDLRRVGIEGGDDGDDD